MADLLIERLSVAMVTNALAREVVEAPAARMVHLEGHFDAGGYILLTNDDAAAAPESALDPRGAELRLRYSVTSDQRDAARVAAQRWRERALGAGAASVKVEEVVIVEARARAPEVAVAKTLDEKLAVSGGTVEVRP